MGRKLLTNALIALLGYGMPNYALAKPPVDEATVTTSSNRSPVARIKDFSNKVIVSDQIMFESESTDADSDQLTLDWQIINEGKTRLVTTVYRGNEEKFNYTFNSAGNYRVFLSANDSKGGVNEISKLITVQEKSQTPVDLAVSPIIVPTLAEIRKYSLDTFDIQLNLGNINFTDKENINLPQPANQSSKYDDSKFNFGVSIPNFVTQINDYLNLRGKLNFNYGFSKDDHKIGINNVGNLSGNIINFNSTSGLELKLFGNNLKAIFEFPVIDLTAVNIEGNIRKPGLKDGFYLKENSIQYTVGSNIGVEGIFGNADINLAVHLFGGSHYYSDKHGATGIVGQLGVFGKFNSRYVAFEGSFLYTLSHDTVSNEIVTEDLSTINWDASILVYPTERFGFGVCSKGSRARPSIIEAQFIETSREINYFSLCVRGSLGEDRNYSGRESLRNESSRKLISSDSAVIPVVESPELISPLPIEPLVESPLPIEPLVESPLPIEPLAPESTSIKRVLGSSKFNYLSLYNLKDDGTPDPDSEHPFDVYNKLASSIQGLPSFNKIQYDIKVNEYKHTIDNLLTMDPSDISNFIIRREILTLDLGLCDSVLETISLAQERYKSSPNIAAILGNYEDRTTTICDSIIGQYRKYNLIKPEQSNQGEQK